MKRVAVLPGRRQGALTNATGLPWQTLDKIQLGPDGAKAPRENDLAGHADSLRQRAWIIDGFGGPPSDESAPQRPTRESISTSR